MTHPAVWVTAYGPPEVLVLRETPDPPVIRREVLIDVRATGVNFADIQRRRGGYPGARPVPFVPGFEAAGTVIAVGPDGPPRLRPGDRVAAFCHEGSYRRVAVARTQHTYVLPEALPFEKAAAILVNGVTARCLLHRAGSLPPGGSVVVTAAAGGVGQQCLQLARLTTSGPRVGLVGDPSKLEGALAAGASEALTYDDPALVARLAELTEGRGVDLALDSVGGEVTARLLDALAEGGRLVVFGRAAGQPGEADIGRLFERRQAIVAFSAGPWRAAHPREAAADAAAVLAMVADGRLQPRIWATLPLAEAAAAHRLVEGRQTQGKVVLVTA